MSNWRDVIGFDGLYQVSRFGVVRRIDRTITVARNGSTYLKRLKGGILPVHTDSYGYVTCALSSKRTRVHRIVAEAWIGPCPDGYECCHGPNGKADNSVSNLRWGSRTDNRNDHYAEGIGNIRRVRRSDGKEYPSLTTAGKDVGRSMKSIQMCCAGTRGKCAGYGWSYISK